MRRGDAARRPRKIDVGSTHGAKWLGSIDCVLDASIDLWGCMLSRSAMDGFTHLWTRAAVTDRLTREARGGSRSRSTVGRLLFFKASLWFWFNNIWFTAAATAALPLFAHARASRPPGGGGRGGAPSPSPLHIHRAGQRHTHKIDPPPPGHTTHACPPYKIDMRSPNGVPGGRSSSCSCISARHLFLPRAPRVLLQLMVERN